MFRNALSNLIGVRNMGTGGKSGHIYHNQSQHTSQSRTWNVGANLTNIKANSHSRYRQQYPISE